MRRWRYTEPGDNDQPVTVEYTEAEILTEYYAFWVGQMRRIGKADQVSERACIEDWVTVHWAEEVV